MDLDMASVGKGGMKGGSCEGNDKREDTTLE